MITNLFVEVQIFDPMQDLKNVSIPYPTLEIETEFVTLVNNQQSTIDGLYFSINSISNSDLKMDMQQGYECSRAANAGQGC